MNGNKRTGLLVLAAMATALVATNAQAEHRYSTCNSSRSISVNYSSGPSYVTYDRPYYATPLRTSYAPQRVVYVTEPVYAPQVVYVSPRRGHRSYYRHGHRRSSFGRELRHAVRHTFTGGHRQHRVLSRRGHGSSGHRIAIRGSHGSRGSHYGRRSRSH